MVQEKQMPPSVSLVFLLDSLYRVSNRKAVRKRAAFYNNVPDGTGFLSIIVSVPFLRILLAFLSGSYHLDSDISVH